MTAVRLCSLNANVWNGIALAWRTVGAFVLVCAWIWSCYLVFDAVLWCRNLALMLCCQNKLQYGNDGCAFIMFVKYMARRHVTHGWLAGTFVFGCPCLESERSCYYWCSMWYETVTSPWCAVQIHHNVDNACEFILLIVWNGVTLTLDEQLVRLYWCVFEFEAVIIGFDAVWWGRNLSLMRCPNTL